MRCDGEVLKHKQHMCKKECMKSTCLTSSQLIFSLWNILNSNLKISCNSTTFKVFFLSSKTSITKSILHGCASYAHFRTPVDILRDSHVTLGMQQLLIFIYFFSLRVAKLKIESKKGVTNRDSLFTRLATTVS